MHTGGLRTDVRRQVNDSTEATMPGVRAFAGQESLPFWLQPSLADDKEGIVDAVRRGVVGDYEPFMSPFGERRVVYSDWSASGR